MDIILQKQIYWINSLKCVGILAVVLGHIASPFTFFIYSWHMPFFFIVSGFFIHFELSIVNYIVKDFKRLMFPYFIFNFLGLGLESIKRYFLHRNELYYIDEIKGIFYFMDIEGLINTYGFVLWFLPALFWGRVFLVIINKINKAIVFQLIMSILLFYISFLINLPFAIDNGFNCTLFILLGSIYYRFSNKFKKIYLLFSFFAFSIICIRIPSLDVAYKSYGNTVINILWSTSFFFILFYLLKRAKLNLKLIDIWGRNTMLLFIIHPYTNNISHIVIERLHSGFWFLKFCFSLLLLHGILILKEKFDGRGLFKYV